MAFILKRHADINPKEFQNREFQKLHTILTQVLLSPTYKDHNTGQLFLGVAFRFKKAKYMIHFLLRALFKCSVEWVPAKSVKVLIICWDFCLPAHSVLTA